MQDEINEKVVALSVKGAKLTAEMLQKAIKAMLAQAKKQQEKQQVNQQIPASAVCLPSFSPARSIRPRHDTRSR